MRPLTSFIEDLLVKVGEDPKRQGLLRTPERACEAWEFLLSGYKDEPLKCLAQATFEDQAQGLVNICDIDFFSMCEHHVLPFFGKCHIGFLPAEKLVGFGALVRLVHSFSRRLQVQEQLTNEIAGAIQQVLKPRGVIVVTQAIHTCMSMRGAMAGEAWVSTAVSHGVLKEDPALAEQFFSLIPQFRPFSGEGLEVPKAGGLRSEDGVQLERAHLD